MATDSMIIVNAALETEGEVTYTQPVRNHIEAAIQIEGAPFPLCTVVWGNELNREKGVFEDKDPVIRLNVTSQFPFTPTQAQRLAYALQVANTLIGQPRPKSEDFPIDEPNRTPLTRQ